MTLEQKTPEVRMTTEGHVCVISLDNTAKKNAITPELMSQLSAHLTTFEDDHDLWVAILDPAGEHTTAGLDMPKFFGPPPRRSRSRRIRSTRSPSTDARPSR
jgi:enoyl-CoA hydratase